MISPSKTSLLTKSLSFSLTPQDLSMCTGVWPASMSEGHVQAVPAKARKWHWISWNWYYRQLWATTRMLGTKLRSSSRAARTLKCWVSSPALTHEILDRSLSVIEVIIQCTVQTLSGVIPRAVKVHGVCHLYDVMCFLIPLHHGIVRNRAMAHSPFPYALPKPWPLLTFLKILLFFSWRAACDLFSDSLLPLRKVHYQLLHVLSTHHGWTCDPLIFLWRVFSLCPWETLVHILSFFLSGSHYVPWGWLWDCHPLASPSWVRDYGCVLGFDCDFFVRFRLGDSANLLEWGLTPTFWNLALFLFQSFVELTRKTT